MSYRYAAIAANYVEVLALGAHSFVQILEHYPGLKERMEKILNGNKEDVFERKIYLLDKIKKRLSPKDAKAFQIGVERVVSAIQGSINYDRSFRGIRGSKVDKVEVMSRSSAFLKFVGTHVLNWGSDNDNLPFLYFSAPHG